MQDQKIQQAGSKISNTEWGLVIGAVVIVDLIQVGLDVLGGLGVLINRFIDIIVGASLALYFYLRGVKMNTKKILTLVGSFVGEELPLLDALPLWTLDVVLTMAWDKADGKIEKVAPILDKAEKISGRVKNISGQQ